MITGILSEMGYLQRVFDIIELILLSVTARREPGEKVLVSPRNFAGK